MPRPRRAIPTLLALVCGVVPLEAQDATAPVRALMDAYNAHDPALMGTFVTSDVEVFYLTGAGVPELGTDGRDQLVEQMTEYFAALPDVASEVVDIIPGPVYVSVRERIVGGAASLAVYEVRGGLIRRVWYFPTDAPGADPRERSR